MYRGLLPRWRRLWNGFLAVADSATDGLSNQAKVVGILILSAGLIFGVISGVPWSTKGEVDARFKETERDVAELQTKVSKLKEDQEGMAKSMVVLRERQQQVMQKLKIASTNTYYYPGEVPWSP